MSDAIGGRSMILNILDWNDKIDKIMGDLSRS